MLASGHATLIVFEAAATIVELTAILDCVISTSVVLTKFWPVRIGAETAAVRAVSVSAIPVAAVAKRWTIAVRRRIHLRSASHRRMVIVQSSAPKRIVSVAEGAYRHIAGSGSRGSSRHYVAILHGG